jgi:hypothetical protein
MPRPLRRLARRVEQVALGESFRVGRRLPESESCGSRVSIRSESLLQSLQELRRYAVQFRMFEILGHVTLNGEGGNVVTDEMNVASFKVAELAFRGNGAQAERESR